MSTNFTTWARCTKVCTTSFEVVPGVGVEPTRKYKFRGILSPLCLPISPPGQTLVGGAFQSRTELYEFAIRCITALLTRHTLERETRFELATLTMARLCSTNWAIPASDVSHYRLFFSIRQVFFDLFFRNEVNQFLEDSLKAYKSLPAV